MADRIVRQFFGDSDNAVEGYAADSGVPETPFDRETFDGACSRARHAQSAVPHADYYIGLESGLVERYGHVYEEAWCAVIRKDGDEFFGYSSGLKVPDNVLKKMDALGKSHSDVMTILEEEHGKLSNDTWGSYSGGVVVREISLEESLRNALVQITAPKESFYRA